MKLQLLFLSAFLLASSLKGAQGCLDYLLDWSAGRIRQLKGTVVAARFAHLFLDSPTLIAMYYLPYENEELKKVVLFSRHCSSLN